MPNWDKLKEQREAQRKAEIHAGRRRTMITMMEGVIEELCDDYKIDKGMVSLDTLDMDARNWEVVIFIAPDVTHRENMWVFPSNEVKTMLMLVSK